MMYDGLVSYLVCSYV